MQRHVPQQEGQVGDQQDVRVLFVSITALTASPGTHREKNLKATDASGGLKLDLPRKKQFSRAVFVPCPELWLRFIGFDPLVQLQEALLRL